MLVSLGSINADFLVRADAAPPGPATVLVRELLRTSGGKAANVAVVGARLGARALLLGCVGDDDLSDQALRGPATAGVDLTAVRRRPGPTGYASIVVSPDGEKSIFLATNANDAWADEVTALADDVAAAPDGSVLVADLEVPIDLVETALHVARHRGFVTVVDPAPPSRLRDDLLPLVDHLTPDRSEAEQLTGLDVGDPSGSLAAAAQLQARGAGSVYVKLASGGCAVASGDISAVVPSPEGVAAVDKTGAGDAFAGALGWALHEGRSVIDAARLAVAASTVAVAAYGSQESYPTRNELDAMAERMPVPTRHAG